VSEGDPRPGGGELDALQAAAGAAFHEVAGRAVARHYGDGAAEYRTVREAAGMALRADRRRIRLWGRDPAKMVHGLITNDLLGAPADRAVYAAMLTPKGRMIADLRAVRRAAADGGAEVLLDLAAEALDGTREHLKKFVPPMFARWEEVTDDLAELGVYGPRAREIAGAALGAALPPLEEDGVHEAETDAGPVLVVATREAGLEEGFDLFVPAGGAAGLWRALTAAGAQPVGFGALETLRVEAGRPRYGAELTEDTIPTEAYEATGLMPRAVSFSKGCYTGQEVVVRIAHRGHVNRHLRGLLLGDLPAPAAGAALFHPETGKKAGAVTSVAHSPLLGQTVALGYVRREVEPGGEVAVGAEDGPRAMVAALPFARPAEGGADAGA
jgi:folate-binding protein YgfZ